MTELDRLFYAKRTTGNAAAPLGPAMHEFVHSVQKRQSKFSRIADCWLKLVPQMLSERCALESFSRGRLTVLVDSASHLYDLKQLLLAGLHQQLIIACKAQGLRQIVLKPGRWYDGNNLAEGKLRFD